MKWHFPASGNYEQVSEAVKKKRERFLFAFEHAPIGMLISDLKGRFAWVNDALAELLEYPIKQLSTMNFLEIIYPEDQKKNALFINEMLKEKNPRFVQEMRFVRADGEVIYVMVHAFLMRGARNRPVNLIAQIVDVTERKKFEQTMRHMAYHDYLTGLPNRILFRDRFSALLSQTRLNKEILAVLFLDLDRFKLINDTLGHFMGDQALKLIAERLTSAVRSTDLVARMGGDEFIIVLPNVVQAGDVFKILPKILESLEVPLLLNNMIFNMTASVGIAMYPRDGQDVDTLIQKADKAMYIAKRKKGIEG